MNQEIKILSHFKNFFKRGKNGSIKAFFSQLSRGLMLPIAILPIAGLLLGIGGAIGANVNTETGKIFANIFKSMSDVVFANLPFLFCIAITITFTKDKGTAAFASGLAFLVFCSSQMPFLQMDKDGKIISILWFHKEITGITTTTLGLPTIQTSIFGGIVVGGITAVIYNYFSKIKLPTYLDFFSGVRLVPFILIPAMFLLSLIFLIFWPWIGQGINFMGKGIQKAPYGTGGLLYGILGRALMPFGLHHIPIVLAYQTDFGGVLSGYSLKKELISNGVLPTSDVYNSILNSFSSFSKTTDFGGQITGDQNIWNFVNSLSVNTLPTLDGQTLPVFDWFNTELGVFAGRFTQDYPTYLGLCMGIGAAMIFAAERKNRRNVSIIIGSSMIVAFLTGITEPLEFSFLFCAPLLYYLIYVPLSGFSYMFMELVGAHIGVGFARGFIDLIVYGIIPFAKGTKFYWAFVFALIEGIFIFIVFYFSIIKFDIATPGRKNNPMNLISKKDYNSIKSSSKIDKRILNIIWALGGKENIKDVSACATRLRVSLVDSKKTDDDEFLYTGSKGVINKSNAIQVIYGGEATIIADKINTLIDDNLIPDYETLNQMFNLDDKHKIQNIKNKEKIMRKSGLLINSCAVGLIKPIEELNDQMFSTKMLGKGVVIDAYDENIYAPCDGKITMIFPTKHAYGITTKEGLNILIHIGLDTVKLNGNGFESMVELNQEVKQNELIAKFDKNLIENENLCSSVIMIVTTDSTYQPIEIVQTGKVDTSSVVIKC